MRPPFTILIVNDEPDNVSLLSDMLRTHGYKLLAEPSGIKALETARASRPDLILLDILMPAMDGFEVCRRLKAQEATKQIPVIFISALDAVWDKVQAFANGGVDYIVKPIQMAEVLARVETHLTIRRLTHELETANAELSRNVAELEDRNADLDAFARTVAHDLKSPLTSVIGYGELLRDGWDSMVPGDIRHYLDYVLKGGQKCNRIVEEILLLASIRQQEWVRLEPLDMFAIIAEAESRLIPLTRPYPGCITKPATLPFALGYAPWVEEVWVNYLSNGIKYGGTPPRITIGAVQFQVGDNGAGIPPDKQDQLFVEFNQLDHERAHGGGVSHGLGLSIVRRIVKRLGGDVGVTSGVEEGSTFWFTLPAVGPSEAQ